jgi:multidrug efflux system membrane fusion protein
VTLGASNGDLVEISRGIEAGDRVVVDGVDKLREGVKVEVAGVHPVDAGMDPTAVDPKAGIARQGNTPAAAAGSANSAPALSTDGNARQ